MIPERCTFCRGSLQEGKTEFIARVGGEIVVARDVPARPTTLSSSATTRRATTITSPSPARPSGSRPTRTTRSAMRSRPGPTPSAHWTEGTLPPAQLFSVPGHNRPGKQPLFRQRLKRQRIVYPGGEVTMSQVKEEIINELNDLPPRTYGEVLDFIRLLKSRRRPGHRARERARAPEGLAPARGGRGVKRFVKGDVVVVPSPFSDISTVKRRPALVVTTPDENDVVLCQTRCSDRNGAGAPQGATSRASRSGTPTPSVSLTWTLQRERSENRAMSGQTGSSLPVPT